MAIERNRDNSLGRSGEGVIQPTSRKWLGTAQQKRSSSGRQYFGSGLPDRQVSARSGCSQMAALQSTTEPTLSGNLVPQPSSTCMVRMF